MAQRIRVRDSGFIRDLRILNATFPEATKRILKELAGVAVKKGQEGIFPRRHNNLASTARVIEEDGKVLFSVGGIQGKGSPSVFVDYAFWVNNGTSKQPGQFFMERATNAALDDQDSIAAKALKSWLAQVEKSS